MQFSIIVLFICFFFFLYILHSIAKDDFIIIRKGIPVEQIFNVAFLTAFVALFFARFAYVIFNPNAIPKTFLGFLALPYFPGLYLAGAVLGGGFFAALYAGYRKLPVGRIFDFFVLSFSLIFPLDILLGFLFSNFSNLAYSSVLFFVYLILGIIFLKLVFPYMQKNVLKEGSLGIFYLICLSVISFLANLFYFWGKLGIFEKDNLLWGVILILCIVITVRQELVEKSKSK